MKGYDVRDECIKCLMGAIHPFHDNGNVNEACGVELFMGINWFNDEKAKRMEMMHVRDERQRGA